MKLIGTIFVVNLNLVVDTSPPARGGTGERQESVARRLGDGHRSQLLPLRPRRSPLDHGERKLPSFFKLLIVFNPSQKETE